MFEKFKNIVKQKPKVQEEQPKVQEEIRPNIDYFFQRIPENEAQELEKNYQLIVKQSKELFKNERIDNSAPMNVNFHTLNWYGRTRDLYGEANNDKQVIYLQKLMCAGSVVSINQFEWFAQLMVKNEIIARRILEIPINKIIMASSVNVKNVSIDIDANIIREIYENNLLNLLQAIYSTELFGGCYVAISDGRIYIYTPTQIKAEHLTKESQHGEYSELYLLNQMLHTRIFNIEWLKEHNCDYIEFNDGLQFPYHRVFCLIGMNRPIGQYNKTSLNYMSYSIFEGSLHHLSAIIDDLNSMHRQLLIQNKISYKIANYNYATAESSKRGVRLVDDSVKKVARTKIDDGFVTDKDNDIGLLAAQVNVNEIIDSALLKLISFIWNIPLKDLTSEGSSQYLNTESVAQQQQTQKSTLNKIKLNYQKSIKDILIVLLQDAGIEGITQNNLWFNYEN